MNKQKSVHELKQFNKCINIFYNKPYTWKVKVSASGFFTQLAE
jgi:hypothetical protein